MSPPAPPDMISKLSEQYQEWQHTMEVVQRAWGLERAKNQELLTTKVRSHLLRPPYPPQPHSIPHPNFHPSPLTSYSTLTSYPTPHFLPHPSLPTPHLISQPSLLHIFLVESGGLHHQVEGATISHCTHEHYVPYV